MMTVDNFDLIRGVFPNPVDGEFYFVQILIRGKDGHYGEAFINRSNKNRLIKYYTFKTLDDLIKKKDEIVSICDACNARAYIHPTKRSFKDVADEMFRLFAVDYTSSNYEGMKGLYSTACGRSFVRSNKKFIVDLDGDDVHKRDEIIRFINNECEPFNMSAKIKADIPTLHGIHLITIPFNTKRFKDRFPDIDVHTNNPTLLYYRKNDY